MYHVPLHPQVLNPRSCEKMPVQWNVLHSYDFRVQKPCKDALVPEKELIKKHLYSLRNDVVNA